RPLAPALRPFTLQSGSPAAIGLVFRAMRPAITAMNTSRAYWTCQLLGWGINASSQMYGAIATLPVPWERVVLEITLLNASALGLTHLLRLCMRHRGWAKLSMRQLLPRSLVASVLLGLA